MTPTPNKPTEKLTIKHKGLPTDEQCLELECLQKGTNEEIQASQKVMTANQEDIKQTLNTMNISLDTMNGTVTRIFGLYKEIKSQMTDHEKTFHEIETFMTRKEVQNGYTEKETHEAQERINQINQTRQPIIDRITRLETNKAEREDITLIREDVNDIKTGLTEIKTEQKKQNDYMIKKEAENGITTVIAQKQDTKSDSRLKNTIQIVMVIIAIAAIIVGALH
jgi:hypothetical protein